MSKEYRNANEITDNRKDQGKDMNEFKNTARGEAGNIDRIGELEENESEGLWTGKISVKTYCRHLEFILSSDNESEPEELKGSRRQKEEEESDSDNKHRNKRLF